ncbi:MAG: hypothetical protein EZS28_050424, partial [Streblomastix strix]
MPFTIKTVCTKTYDVRRFLVDGAPTIEQLRAKIGVVYGFENTESIVLKYVDCEGDFVTIATTEDIQAAFEMIQEKKVLKLFLIGKWCKKEKEQKQEEKDKQVEQEKEKKNEKEIENEKEGIKRCQCKCLKDKQGLNQKGCGLWSRWGSVDPIDKLIWCRRKMIRKYKLLKFDFEGFGRCDGRFCKRRFGKRFGRRCQKKGFGGRFSKVVCPFGNGFGQDQSGAFFGR